MQRSAMASALLGFSVLVSSIMAQEKSVRPGINDSFRDPKVSEFQEKFEIESREVFAKRIAIVEACKVTQGMTVADIGAGTGVFTRLFSEAVGPKGQVFAVDIASNFLEHINSTNREAGRKNAQTVQCTPDSTKLEPATVDVAYICDTYHHFEFPLKTMSSLHAALKPGGRLFLVDFERVEGESTEWTMKHVRAGQKVFEAEILSCGFKKVREHSGLLKENYFIEFERVEPTK
ncbi:MAG: class I SAM-dependent methyltransferase [Pirellulaceae bacterium]|nr:class I SAM-dependent methyltransferase [Pirellulaceae bacterium]